MAMWTTIGHSHDLVAATPFFLRSLWTRLPLALVVGCSGLIAVGCVVAEHAVDDHGEVAT